MKENKSYYILARNTLDMILDYQTDPDVLEYLDIQCFALGKILGKDGYDWTYLSELCAMQSRKLTGGTDAPLDDKLIARLQSDISKLTRIIEQSQSTEVEQMIQHLNNIIKNQDNHPLKVMGGFIVGATIVRDDWDDLRLQNPLLDEIAELGAELEIAENPDLSEEIFRQITNKLSSLNTFLSNKQK